MEHGKLVDNCSCYPCKCTPGYGHQPLGISYSYCCLGICSHYIWLHGDIGFHSHLSFLLDYISSGKLPYILDNNFAYNNRGIATPLYVQSCLSNILAFRYPDSKRSWANEKTTWSFWVKASSFQLTCVTLMPLIETKNLNINGPPCICPSQSSLVAIGFTSYQMSCRSRLRWCKTNAWHST